MNVLQMLIVVSAILKTRSVSFRHRQQKKLQTFKERYPMLENVLKES